ncbi:BTB/POZ domain-containing protein KCTD21-like [Antedon mediterranea]|uniref:BTB/POZ domain-containing protein KCTD21-like n=1 Tax=Antedon mediterranea TaxID=105859 RepID=UPI003AF49386
MKTDQIINLNVGGKHYVTNVSTLTMYPDSMIGSMFSGRFPPVKDNRGSYVIDRDGKIFRYILNFLRTAQLCLPDHFSEWDLLEAEADFYQIEQLSEAILAAKESRGLFTKNVTFELEQRKHWGGLTEWYGYTDSDVMRAMPKLNRDNDNRLICNVCKLDKESLRPGICKCDDSFRRFFQEISNAGFRYCSSMAENLRKSEEIVIWTFCRGPLYS